MTKDEATTLLLNNGYDARLENGAVVVYSKNSKDFSRIKKMLKEEGYNSSFGWKLTHETS